MDKDNSACSFVLTEIEELLYRGGGSVRENPFNSLHWQYAQEVAMWESGFWHDWRYAACCFGGARNKLQRVRHNTQQHHGQGLHRLAPPSTPLHKPVLGPLHCLCWKLWQILVPSFITFATERPWMGLPSWNWDGEFGSLPGVLDCCFTGVAGLPIDEVVVDGGTQRASRAV